jgi:exo-beta-1,3-glucanase (GH17 family)/cellulose synthase/poly-beta-1,6-N-acetylglucosamine synthase-like glycosyltransferase
VRGPRNCDPNIRDFNLAAFLTLLKRTFVSVLIASGACALVAGAWFAMEHPVTPADWDTHARGLTYSGYRPGQGPAQHKYPSAAEIDEDMRLLAAHTGRIRTYTATEGPDVAAIAARHGLDVMAGAWLNTRKADNDREFDALMLLAKQHANISRLIVGNEVLLREELTEAQVIAYLDAARKKTNKPVSIADTWNTWMEHPRLAEHVDFIAIHILPYWENEAVETAVDYTISRLQKLRAAYPTKPIVITETGWPSRGDTMGAAQPTPKAQALYLREFAQRAKALGIDYYFIEGIDGQWKRDEEGRAGPHWGMFDAYRHWKIPATGTLWDDQDWLRWGTPAMALAALLASAFCFKFSYWRVWAQLCFSASMASLIGFMVWRQHAQDGTYAPLQWAALDWMLNSLLLLGGIVLLVQLFEALDVLGTRKWTRHFGPQAWPMGQETPRVSIHLACANEPPAMVIATLESLKQLDWPALEVLVVDNNTRDEMLWRPVRAWVEQNSERFKFWSLPVCEGFKAGALNFALEHMHPDTLVVGVVDADYIVEQNWLRDLMGHFQEDDVAVVQSPQAHRDFEHDLLARSANWEFEGFFRAGMHHRNERNAIIQHGTMCLVRASALRTSGGWAQWTLCEDTELGLRLMTEGWQLRYVDAVYGRGLTPDSFASLRSQRRRWALGAMQIMKGHAASIFGASRLTIAQRYHFVAGWLPWLQEAIQLLVAVMCIVWTLGMMIWPRFVEPPIPGTLGLLLCTVIARVIIGAVIYRVKVHCTWRQSLEAAIASMALNYAVACGVWAGLLGNRFGQRAVFVVTGKIKAARTVKFLALPEAKWAVALVIGAVATLVQCGYWAPEPRAWAAALLVMALPYLAAAWLTAYPRFRRFSVQPVGPVSPPAPARA